MSSKTNKQAAKRKAELSKTRPDLSTARQPENTYIEKIEGPKIGDRAEWVKRAYANGVSLRELIKGSGFRTKQVLVLVGLEPDKHPELVAELEHFRANMLNYRD